ncbi:protein of unknown function [Cupriavidus neocaledonicus]|uniref:Uncharacterized protein n=1 Tax=Cupriavidus neocaledonicus TaxID=1040979 RepID=A0A375H7D4_9BURK|nr:hypothetical protein CBM2605_A140076 [Cupriavidus neocaledonicus]SPD46788.1 protein of unknown function [Cupriavidus neocaledonicus]
MDGGRCRSAAAARVGEALRTTRSATVGAAVGRSGWNEPFSVRFSLRTSVRPDADGHAASGAVAQGRGIAGDYKPADFPGGARRWFLQSQQFLAGVPQTAWCGPKRISAANGVSSAYGWRLIAITDSTNRGVQCKYCRRLSKRLLCTYARTDTASRVAETLLQKERRKIMP